MGDNSEKRTYRPASETRELIFEKAVELMSKHGYQGASVRDICRELGIPIGSFYNCYKSKLDILNSFYTESDGYFADVVDAQLRGLDCLSQLRLFVISYAKLNADTGLDKMRVLFNPDNRWFSKMRPMQEVLTRVIREGIETGQLRSGLEPEHTVELIFDSLRGVCYNWCTAGGRFDLEKRMLEHVELVTSGLFAPKVT